MRTWTWILASIGGTIPGLALRVSGADIGNEASAAIFGLAIVSGAFLLSWASEVAELDIPRSLAITALAVIAVLPEYAIDVYLAWTAAYTPENVSLATANMTGANRLLIGIGWSMVVFLFWLTTKRGTINLHPSTSPALLILTLATAYAFTIVIKGYLHIADTVVLGGLFILYIWMNFKGEVEPPHLVGPSARIGALPALQRRTVVLGMFVYAAVVIVLAAEPFVEGLKGTGEGLGLSEFLLIQWIAPLASETPEILLAAIFVLRGRGQDGMALLISSKVNQWTLLVATLPAVFSISAGSLDGMPLDSRQTTEIFLTAAQSLFAAAVIMDMRISLKEAGMLFVLFFAQLLVPMEEARLGFASLYMLLTLVMLFTKREYIKGVPKMISNAFAGRGSGPGGG